MIDRAMRKSRVFVQMHIVTYSSLFEGIGQAMSTTRGLAVIGLFFEVGTLC